MSKQILVVDDEPNVRLNYRITLETGGYTVTEADSAARALELLAAGPFDLAILDLRMPGMDGLELLATMRRRGNTTPSIIVTAYGDIPDVVHAMKLGAIDFLRKPLTPEQLRRIAAEVIERHQEGLDQAASAPADLTPEELQERHLQIAKRHLNRQEFGDARVHLAKTLAINPLSSEAFTLTGLLFEMQGDHEQAHRHYLQALKIDPHYEPARQHLQRLAKHAGR